MIKVSYLEVKMRVLFFLFTAVFVTGCYPKFNFREPVYIVPGPTYRWPCEVLERAEDCRRTIVDAAEMWFLDVPEKNRPKIIVTYNPPIKTANEIIHIEVDSRLGRPAHLSVGPLRPLTIVIRIILIGPVGKFVLTHELGHVFLGPHHESGDSIMRATAVSRTLRPTPSDLARLCKRHPELRCPQK